MVHPNRNKRYIVLIAGPRRHYIINQFKKYKIPFLYYGNYNYIRDNEDDNLINNHPANIINMLYNLADIYLVTSKIEGGPKAILETGLTKTLIFSTDVGLSKDFIHQDLIYSEENIYKVLDFLNNFEKNEDKIKNYVEFNFNNIKRVLDEKYYTSLYRNLLKTEL